MSMKIPAPLIAALSSIIPEQETHTSINTLFMHADAPGDPPEGTKQVKVQEWLRRANRELANPMGVIGPLIESYMEVERNEFNAKAKDLLDKILTRCNLTYIEGGHVSPGGSIPSLSLAELIRNRDLSAIETEFHRALKNITKNPREAASAAGNILESTCKTFIEDNELEMPAKKDLKSVWAVVRNELKFDPKKIEDDDLRKIVSGMLNTVDGITSLRTHASSAHGQGRSGYKLEPRHARLAVNAAHSVTSSCFPNQNIVKFVWRAGFGVARKRRIVILLKTERIKEPFYPRRSGRCV